MRTKFLGVVGVVVTMSMLATSPAFAKFPKKGKGTPAPIAPDTNDKITALHLTAISITVGATHQAKEFKITPSTQIIVNGQVAQLSSLAVGMDVSVTPTPNDATTAATIDAKTHKR